jgi:hypothetical protein
MKGLYSFLVFCFAVLIPGIAFAEITAVCPEYSPFQQGVADVAGYLDSPGVFLFLGAILVVAGFGGLLSRFIDFSWMSANAWGVIGCALSAGMMSYGLWAPEMLTGLVPQPVVTFIGALIFAPSLAALLSGGEGPDYVYTGILTAVYTGVAIWLGSHSIGFLAVLALLCTLGFTAFGGGLSYCIGFESEDKIPGATIAGILLAGGFTLAEFYGVNTSWFEVFKDGAFWVGTFVAGIGMLIISAKWYTKEEQKRRMPYLLRQILTFAVLAGSMYAGVMINNGTLLYIGTAFMMLFIIEKLYEIAPENRTSYFTLTLILGVIAIFGANWYSGNEEAIQTYIASLRA